MTLDHRKVAITADLLNKALDIMTDSLARKIEENEALQAKVKELEAKLSPKPESVTTAQ